MLCSPTQHYDKDFEDGSASVRYRMVQPDTVGNPKVTEFIINEYTIEVPGCLRGD